jgi:drug/metabolite transporter (DMT)-like permease
MHTGVLYALLAALTFGASTPLAKSLLGQVAPVGLAALLYLGSGLGLSLVYLLRRGGGEARLTRPDLPWLAGAILCGGVAGPVLLMTGLAVTPASSASLLLNMEGVLTALLAWFVFKENYDRRILLGMLLIVAGGALLGWQGAAVAAAGSGATGAGVLAILGACMCWAVDNNLTRKVAASDAVQIAAVKGLVAGTVNLVIAFHLGFTLPSPVLLAGAALLGFCGYGLSLVCFVLALRHLGSARTGAYFSLAPFAGAALALLMGEQATAGFWIAGGLMAGGLWLHLAERHQHEHTHQPTAHRHTHRHDEHHQHAHPEGWDGREPHSHHHVHAALTHSHVHYPDIHHRHTHL